MRAFTVIAAISFLIVLSQVAEGDGGCPGNECVVAYSTSPEMYEPFVIAEATVLTGERTLAGLVMVSADLTVRDCSLTIEGAALIVAPGASLSVFNSTIRSNISDDLHRFFISSEGPLVLDGSTLTGCMDPSNGIMGIYAYNGSVEIQRTRISESGLIFTYDCDTSIVDSTVPGLFSYNGSVQAIDSVIDGYGISYEGTGDVVASECRFTTDLTFMNGVSALSSVGGGSLIALNDTFDGSYSAGIYSMGGRVHASGLHMDLPEAYDGIKLDGCTVDALDDILMSGAFTGISIHSCTGGDGGPVHLDRIEIDRSAIGVFATGYEGLAISDTHIAYADVGIRSLGPSVVEDTSIERTNISILLEGGHSNRITGCSFIDYGMWAIEEQSWDGTTYEDNSFEPSPTSPGRTAWWGYYDIEVASEGGDRIPGASLRMETDLGDYRRSPGRVDLIWAYQTEEGAIIHVSYSANASYGVSHVQVPFVPTRGNATLITLPLFDAHISHVEFDRGTVRIIAGSSNFQGSATITLLIDGRVDNTTGVELHPGAPTIVTMTLPEMDGEEHLIRAEVFSSHEFKGDEGALQENNAYEVVFSDRKGGTDSGLVTWIAISALVLGGLVVLMIDRRPKG